VSWVRNPKFWFWFGAVVAVFGVMGFFFQPAWIAGLHFPAAAGLAGIGLMLQRQRDTR
jgi:hypothetical protein